MNCGKKAAIPLGWLYFAKQS